MDGKRDSQTNIDPKPVEKDEKKTLKEDVIIDDKYSDKLDNPEQDMVKASNDDIL